MPLSRDQLGQRRALGALHAGDRRPWSPRPASALRLRDDVLLLLAELAGRGVGVLGRRLLVGERLLELGSLDSRQLLLADVGVGQLLVGLVLAGGEVELLGRRGLGRRARGRDRRGLARLLRRHRGDRLGDRLGLVRRRLGGGLDVLGLALLALVTRPLTSPLTSPALPDSL